MQPLPNQLTLRPTVQVAIRLPQGAAAETVEVTLDGAAVTDQLVAAGREVAGTLSGLSAGWHMLRAAAQVDGERVQGEVAFEAISLDRPDECEILNAAECLLPYPSSRFLVPADTPTGWRLSLPFVGMPAQGGQSLSPEPYEELDGFSPTVQILMHFPGGIDPVASGASRLMPDSRTYGTRSLDPDSPTVLLDADTGERVLHFIEVDARALGAQRQVVFLRPARSLVPGHRYIVAVRNLVHPDGSAVEAEPVFAALRDGRPSDIAALEARRERFEQVFARLSAAGVERRSLVLAFDFVVQSDEGLTGQMLSMRDQAFAWLAEQEEPTFTVDRIVENDCGAPGTSVWRIVEGTFRVPLFLTSDPIAEPLASGYLNLDERGVPQATGFAQPPYTIAIPCAVLSEGPVPPLLLGHGLFGDGRGMVRELASSSLLRDFPFVAGATDWSGLSTRDIAGGPQSFIVSQIVFRLDNFRALPDRLRQGQLHALVLARMMKQGLFNADPVFRTPGGTGVLAGPEAEAYYFGASLGGIMGLMFAALSPDISRANVDVPAINFSFLLQRATPFLQFEDALRLTGLDDPMRVALAMSLIGELWVRGESAGYATHITRDPLPGTNAKKILMTMAWLDQQVSNQGTEIAARTLGLPNLAGSLRTGLPEIPDLPGPLDSALVIYDTGSFDLANPAHQPFIPPLANLQATPNACDPHGLRAWIPASIEQLRHFLRPDGKIENFCHGLCDAGDPWELPFGAEQPCDPLAGATRQ